MQALYLVEVESHTLRRIKARPKSTFMTASFSPDSQLILVAWECDEATYHYTWEVLDLNGRQLAEWRDPDCAKTSNLAHLKGHRVAMPHRYELRVWDLTCGKLIGKAGPPPPAPEPGVPIWLQSAGIVATDPTRCQIAFCVTNTLVVHLYNAASLSSLGSVRVPDHVYNPSRCFVGMLWGVYGWAFLIQHSEVLDPHCTYHACMLTPQAGSTKLKQVLWGDEVPDQLPAVSPCGRFVVLCSTKPRGVVVNVHDSLSGQLVQSGQASPDTLYKGASLTVAKVWWSGCGYQVFVSLTEQRRNSKAKRQHVLCLHFTV